MSSSYQNYQKARDASWQCLIDHGVSKLPISISELLRAEGIPFGCYCDNRMQLRKNGLFKLMENDGFTLMDGAGKQRVYFNELLPPPRCRFTLAHELGHIYLGHLRMPEPGCSTVTVLNREPHPFDDPWETEANIFASRLLAPACVLKELGLNTPEEIAALCGISLTAARFRAERMEKLNEREHTRFAAGKRSCFYLSPLEQQVSAQFSEFIQAVLASRRPNGQH